MEHIKLFEERQFSGVKSDRDAKLMPVNEGGGAALLKIVSYLTLYLNLEVLCGVL